MDQRQDLGDLVCFSFHPNKNMTTIEGGALVVNDEREARRVEELRFHGIRRNADGTRDVAEPGSKYNMSDVSARLGVEQMPDITIPVAFVDVAYPGASPEAVEREVSKPIAAPPR